MNAAAALPIPTPLSGQPAAADASPGAVAPEANGQFDQAIDHALAGNEPAAALLAALAMPIVPATTVPAAKTEPTTTSRTVAGPAPLSRAPVVGPLPTQEVVLPHGAPVARIQEADHTTTTTPQPLTKPAAGPSTRAMSPAVPTVPAVPAAVAAATAAPRTAVAKPAATSAIESTDGAVLAPTVLASPTGLEHRAAPTSTAAPTVTGAPTATEIPPLHDQVAAAVGRVHDSGDGSYHLSLHLHPAELGNVHVDVTVHDGTVTLMLTADDPTARHLLHTALGDLRHSLEAGGLQVGDLGVGDGRAGTDDHHSRGQPALDGPLESQPESARPERPASRPAVGSQTRPEGVDLHL